MPCFNIYPVRIDTQEQARKLLRDMGVWPEGVKIMTPKSKHFVVKVGPLKPQAAHIIKQEMLSKGGEAALSGSVFYGEENSYALLLGTLFQFQEVLPKLRMQPFGLAKLGEELQDFLNNLSKTRKERVLNCNGKEIVIGRRTLVMGILNVTPDSFYDGGRYDVPKKAVERALEMEEQGADIIDIGAESTRPSLQPIGSQPLSTEEELTRLLPVLERVVEKVKVPVSVDTYKGEVARIALKAGANIINDVSGFGDPDMAGVAAEFNVPIVIMHSVPESGDDIMEGIINTLRDRKEKALVAGVREENIILDPGIGFAKDTRQNLEVINRLDMLKCLGQPVLLGTSRKSVIGNTLNLPVEERLEGTAATVTVGIIRGADIVRVHDVKEMVRVARMTDSILGTGEDQS